MHTALYNAHSIVQCTQHCTMYTALYNAHTQQSTHTHETNTMCCDLFATTKCVPITRQSTHCLTGDVLGADLSALGTPGLREADRAGTRTIVVRLG